MLGLRRHSQHDLSIDGFWRSTGMDLRTEEACKKTFREIDDVVGLKYLKAVLQTRIPS